MMRKRPSPMAVLPLVWLVLFFALPFAIIAKLSLSQVETAMPPYSPVFQSWSLTEITSRVSEFSLANYALILHDDLYLKALWASLKTAALSTIILLLMGYPMAFAMAKAPRHIQPLLVMAIILPFWTSFLIRVYALVGILRNEGLLNQSLLALGIISEPLTIVNTQTGVMIGMVYTYLPFMVLPLYATLERMDGSLVEAARDLGAGAARAFWRITLPLSAPGIVAGSLLCFIPILGEVVIPDLLGGTDTLMIGKTLWTEFFANRDWPMASAVAVILLIVLLGPVILFQRQSGKGMESAL